MKKKKITKKEPTVKQYSLEQRRRRAFDMKIMGMTEESIAEALEVDHRTIQRDLHQVRKTLVAQLIAKRKNPDIEGFWTERLESLHRRRKEAWIGLNESKSDRSKLQDVITMIDKEIERAHQMAGIKLTDVNPDDMTPTETFRVVVQGLPDRKGFNDKFKNAIKPQ